MAEDTSVSRLIADLKAGDEQAAQSLWDAYCERLVGFARAKLGSQPRRVADEEDVAVDAFHSFCRGAQKGGFRKLEDREDLWQLLVVISTRKAIDQIKHEQRGIRGGGDVAGESVFLSAETSSKFGIEQVMGSEPTPEFVAMLSEGFDQLLNKLNGEHVREVALLKLERYTNQEIAGKLGISLRSVERKLGIIRQTWELHAAEL